MNSSQPSEGERSPRDYSLPGAPEGLGSMIGGIIGDLQEIVRGEVQLAKTELKEDATTIGRGAGFIAGGALIGLVGFIFLMLAVTYLLDKWVDRWVGAGIVAIVLLVIAAILAMSGRSQITAANLKPEQSIESLKEDKEWANRQIKSVKK
ncbi:MAG: phage holin family protein [Chloroflexota bacterium]|nr:phage holin family protein [Chloroflexota bacterium]